MDLHHSQNSKNLECVMQHRGNCEFGHLFAFLETTFLLVLLLFYFVWKKSCV